MIAWFWYDHQVIHSLFQLLLYRRLHLKLEIWQIDEGVEITSYLENSSKLGLYDWVSQIIRFWNKLANVSAQPAALVYGGNRSHVRSGIHVYPWYVF